MFILLTATVTISAPDAFIALEHSIKFLYLPVPTIRRELNFLLKSQVSLSSLSSPIK